MVYFKENYFSRVPEGMQHFPGGGGLALGGSRGIQMLISIEIYRTCDFLGWVRTPIPPPSLWISACYGIFEKVDFVKKNQQTKKTCKIEL